MQIHLDFTYTFEDTEAPQRLVQAEGYRPYQGRRGLIGLAVIAASIAILWWLNRTLNGPPAPVVEVEDHNPLHSTLALVLLCCLAVAGLLLLTALRRLQMTRFSKQAHAVSIDIDETGLIFKDALNETNWKWDAFDKVLEGKNQICIRAATNRSAYIIIPKRALANTEHSAELCEFIRSRIAGQTV